MGGVATGEACQPGAGCLDRLQTKGMPAMITLLNIIDYLLGVAFFIMIVHIIFSWLITFQVLNLRQPIVAQIWYGLNRLLEPIYRPIRRFLPDTGGLDLAPLVAFIGIIILRDFVIADLRAALY